METLNVYEMNGFDNRNEYLESLSEQYDMDLTLVTEVADFLGESEDFDGLVSIMEDMSGRIEFDVFDDTTDEEIKYQLELEFV